MNTCGSCFGAGKVTCSACGGRGHISRFASGGLETNSCAVCYGSGRMRCNFCGGRGQVNVGGQSVSSKNPEVMYHKGIALWSGNGYTDPNLAIKYFTMAIRLDSNNSNTYHARGLAHHQLGNFTNAIADFSQAISLYSDDAECYNARGNSYYAMNKLNKARKDWEKACAMGSMHGRENIERFL